MKKTSHGFEIETDSDKDVIRISQSDEYCIIISPDEVDGLVSWLQRAKAEMRAEEVFQRG
jgi:hypothetical protein